MAARSIGSGTITFGLVSIPVRLYSATRAQAVSFNMLHRDCGSRVSQQLICPAHDPPPKIERTDTVKGFEYARDQYVTFADDELKALEATQSGTMDVEEFVPAAELAPLGIERSYYLGPDKGGDRGYRLFSAALDRAGVVAIATFAKRGKDCLVAIAPHATGLVLHECYYAEEICAFEDVEVGAAIAPTQLELELADKLITNLRRGRFERERFHDKWAERVRAAVERKIHGEGFVAPAPAAKAPTRDLIEALRESLGSTALAKGPKKASPRKAVEMKKRRHQET